MNPVEVQKVLRSLLQPSPLAFSASVKAQKTSEKCVLVRMLGKLCAQVVFRNARKDRVHARRRAASRPSFLSPHLARPDR